MSIPIVLQWSESFANLAVIAASTTLAGAGSLAINSNLPNSQVSTHGPYVYDKMARTVSFTSNSATSNAGVAITITGIGSAVDSNGNPTGIYSAISETISAGPAGYSIVNSANIYTQISAISVNGAITSLSAGFGTTGVTDYVFMDYNRSAWYATVQAQLVNHVALSYTINQSLTKPETPVIQYGTLASAPAGVPAFAVSTATTNATTNQIAQLTFPVCEVWANVINPTTIKEPVDLATTAALPAGVYANGASGVGATFTVTATGILTIDGVQTALNDRILVKNQASALQNGIYTVTTAGAVGVSAVLTRATDYDQAADVNQGDHISVSLGSFNAGTNWTETGAGPFTMGTTAITFTQTTVESLYFTVLQQGLRS